MNTYELKSMNVSSLSKKEMIETEGGFIGLLVVYALQFTVVAAIVASVAASFERGYEQGMANQQD